MRKRTFDFLFIFRFRLSPPEDSSRARKSDVGRFQTVKSSTSLRDQRSD